MATVGGFINETHAEEIKETFGAEIAKKVEEAPEGTTFLSLLFEDF